MIRWIVEPSVRWQSRLSANLDGVLRFVPGKSTLIILAAALLAALVGGLIQALVMQLRLQAPVPAPARIATVIRTDRNDPCARLKRLERDICIAQSVVGQAPTGLRAQHAARDTRRAIYAMPPSGPA
jgi:hypothetical protein